LKDKTKYLNKLTDLLVKPKKIIEGLDHLEVKRFDGQHVVIELPGYGSFWISGNELIEVEVKKVRDSYLEKLNHLLKDC
jgi:GTP-binding protein EngB required for normal cell division